MIRINEELINRISSQAKESPRKRMNYNFHSLASDPLQRMLNAIEPGSYIQPHKHEKPAKREAFFALRGKIAVIEFNDKGEITEHIILDPKKGNYGTEVKEGTWHMILALEPGSVAYEVKDGPYDPDDDKSFARWAPAEGDHAADAYLQDIINSINTS